MTRPSIRLYGHDATSLTDLEQQLRSMGYSVTGAETTAPVLTEDRDGPAGDVVVYDMRSHPSGSKALRDLGRMLETAELPVVVLLNAREQEKRIEHAPSANCRLLESPFNDSELEGSITSVWQGQKLAVQARVQARWLEQLLEASWDAMITTDRKGVVQMAGVPAETVLGASASDLEGQPIETVLKRMLGAQESLVRDVRRALSGERPTWEGDTMGGPQARRVRIRASAVLDTAGRNIGGLLILRPESMELSGAAARSESLPAARSAPSEDAGLTSLVSAGVGHLLNNALQVIIGHSELVGGGLPGRRAVAASVDTIRRTAIRASRHVERLIDFTRSEPDEHTPNLDVGRWLTSAAERWAKQLPPQVRLVHPAPLAGALVRVRTAELDWLLDALVKNAVASMPAGGTLTLAVRRPAIGSEFARSGRGEAYVICVEDTGTGIDPEAQVHLFEPFFTTRSETGARGLGLAAVYEIVQRNGGSIEVETHVGRGAAFRVSLPEAGTAATASPHVRPRVAEQAHREADEPSDRSRDTVLVVNDDSLVRSAVRKQLKSMNMEVVVARDAESALEILADRSRSLSLLITDVAMPGIDGMELVRRARSTRARLPVLFITAYRSANVTELIARDKMAARLEKPFQTDDLTRAVRDLMAR